jgi:hypothetical protein
MPFPVVFHTQSCAVRSRNPTVSSVYLPTPRWHILKTHSFLAIRSADEHRMIYSFSNTTSYATFYAFIFFFSDNIMADVTSKQQTTASFLSTTVTRTRKHTELTKKLTNLMGNLCCAREHSVQFSVQFFLHSYTAQFILKCVGPFRMYGAL